MTVAASDAEALVERRGAAGVIVLNRPKALNALTLAMVRIMAPALDAWERDTGVSRIVIRGAGDRAFCAGGDIRHLYEIGRVGDHETQRAFWREEYELDRRLKTYPKPVVALVDGIDMGGGVGLSLNASHCVVSERFLFAMPEVGIGFFPDVGATFFLPRLPRGMGAYFALTGLRASAGDAVGLGMAAAFVPSLSFAALLAALESGEPVETAIGRFSAPPPPSPLMADAEAIEACFSLADRDAILDALGRAEREGRAFAGPALKAMGEKSPTSQAIALRQMALGASLDFDEALRTEFRIVSRVCRGRDFYEGVRAVLVDKDNRPRWAPAPSTADVDAYFAPLADELAFPAVRR